MTAVQHRLFPHFVAASALLSTLGACATSDVQLEPLRATLNNDGGVEEGDDGGVDDAGGGGDSEDGADGVACLAIVAGFGVETTRYDVRMNGRRLFHDGEPQQIAALGAGGSTAFCIAAGSYNVSLLREGTLVAQTGDLSLAADQQVIVIAYGAEEQPDVAVSNIDRTLVGKSLRRMRVTNIVPDQQPLQLIYYDEGDREVARSPIVAYGDSNSSTIPAAAAFWRVHADENRFPITAGNADAENRCIEPQAAGLILLARQPEGDSSWTYSFGNFSFESYMQPTRDCHPVPAADSDGGAPRKPNEVSPVQLEP